MKRIFVLICLLVSIKFAFSQPYQIGALLNQPNIGLPDTVSVGDSVLFSAYIKNFGTNTYFGTFSVYLAVDTGNGLGAPILLNTLTAQINAGDTIPYTHFDSIPSGPSPLRIGGNIIVIWPASINFQAFDSVWANVFVLGSNSVGEIIDKNTLKVYPNPTSDEITVLQTKNNNNVVRVRIFDKTGKEVAVIYNSAIIDLRLFASGTYLAEAEFADKTKSSFKIVKH